MPRSEFSPSATNAMRIGWKSHWTSKLKDRIDDKTCQHGRRLRQRCLSLYWISVPMERFRVDMDSGYELVRCLSDWEIQYMGWNLNDTASHTETIVLKTSEWRNQKPLEFLQGSVEVQTGGNSMTIISAPLTKSELPVVDVGNVKMMIRLNCILIGCSEVDLAVNENEDAFLWIVKHAEFGWYRIFVWRCVKLNLVEDGCESVNFKVERWSHLRQGPICAWDKCTSIIVNTCKIRKQLGMCKTLINLIQ